ncbi:MAG: hypothetical protein L6R42_006435 [Xanthoria sp. 1 TBL-2021]|nr:MAG: hypothetical protein L6R42_006435 [Xanthoria sp. 1 TBL-2021]
MGQTLPYRFYIVTVDHTYNQPQFTIIENKHAAIIAAQGDIVPSASELEAFANAYPELVPPVDTEPDKLDAYFQSKYRHWKAHELIRLLFGMRTSRTEWTDAGTRRTKLLQQPKIRQGQSQCSLSYSMSYLKYRDMIPRLNVFVTLPEDLLKDTIQAPDDDELKAHTLRIV